MDNFVGKRIDGKYEIQEVIGVGGMAVVYKAYDTINDRIVAVKILKDELLDNEDFRRKFKNESKAIAILNHPNIVKVFDVSFGDKIQYIVMEYIDGITLKEYINAQDSIGWKEAVHFEMQILQALQHAHDKGIIHRDIKPQNIMLLQNGTIKVTDFGIARFSRSDTRTMTNSAIGSVHYISPEQARGDFTNERADIYSAGVVLYELLTGKVPFNADSAVSIAIMQLEKDAAPPRSVNPDIPLGLEQITMRAMQKNPRNRYQSAAEMLIDLKKVAMDVNTVFDYNYVNGDKYDNGVPIAVVPVGDHTRLVNVLEKEDKLEKDELSGKNISGDNETDGEDEDDYYRKKYGSDEKKKNNKKGKKVAIIVASVIAGIALLAGLGFLIFGGGKIVTPDFVGKNYDNEISPYVDEDNTYIKGDIKCKIEVEYTDDFDKYGDYKSGDVVAQSPEAGKKINEKTAVKLTILSDGELIKIPDVKGMTESAAKRTLKDAGFNNISTKEKPNMEISKGNVISTDPAIGTAVDADGKITLYVSSGNTVKMKNVVGMSRSDAEKMLEDLELSIKYETEDSKKDKDIVIAQSVKEGAQIEMGTTITLTVSSGTAPTTTTTTTTQKAETTVIITASLPGKNAEGVEGGDGKVKVYLDGRLVDTGTYKFNGGKFTYEATGKSGSQSYSVEAEGHGVIKEGIVNYDTGTIS